MMESGICVGWGDPIPQRGWPGAQLLGQKFSLIHLCSMGTGEGNTWHQWEGSRPEGADRALG